MSNDANQNDYQEILVKIKNEIVNSQFSAVQAHRELNYKTNLKYTLDFSQTDAQIEPMKKPPLNGGFLMAFG